MVFFGTPNSYLGLDIGTSSLKVVELVNRRKRVEVGTYGQINFPNPLINPDTDEDKAIAETAQAITKLLDAAQVSTDAVIAALPSSIVFSSVINLPAASDADMDKAVHFAARDIVPADLSETVLGWSILGGTPHLDSDHTPLSADKKEAPPKINAADSVPVFLTAAPKEVVNRYERLIKLLKLNLVALEVETFSLARSLLSGAADSALIIDIGDRVTTYHIVDRGAPRVSFTLDYGGKDITAAIASSNRSDTAQAESLKVKYGLGTGAPQDLRLTINNAVLKIMEQSRRLLDIYSQQSGRVINKTILIGGGANLPDLAPAWSNFLRHKVSVGNPWQGLAVPDQLVSKLTELGPAYAVAVGLAQRQISQV
ncbi:MAG: pilus assembly protein PilM [bacterium]|nr:pilus assembly protein PilM [bacterium]MDZ4346637.1 pilus assembly protein PilM [Candidatus Binatia bacterium]